MTEIIEKKEQADQFLSQAFQDIESSIVLYEAKKYSNAVFYLQQSVEKAIKSYVFQFDPEEADPLKIRHRYLQVIKKSNEKFRQKREDLRKNTERYNAAIILTKNIGFDYQTIVDKILSNQEDFNKLIDISERKREFTESEVISLVVLMEEVDCDFEDILHQLRFKKIDEVKWDQNIDDLSVNIKAGIREIYSGYDLSEEARESRLNEIEDQLFEWKNGPKDVHYQFLLFLYLRIGGMILLSLVGLLVSAHEQSSRYPDEKKKFNPLDFYTLELPLVFHLPAIQKYTSIALGWLRESYDLLETLPKIMGDDSNTGNI